MVAPRRAVRCNLHFLHGCRGVGTFLSPSVVGWTKGTRVLLTLPLLLFTWRWKAGGRPPKAKHTWLWLRHSRNRTVARCFWLPQPMLVLSSQQCTNQQGREERLQRQFLPYIPSSAVSTATQSVRQGLWKGLNGSRRIQNILRPMQFPVFQSEDTGFSVLCYLL